MLAKNSNSSISSNTTTSIDDVPRYVVISSRALVSGYKWNVDCYYYSAIVELDDFGRKMYSEGREPKMISERARGVRRVIEVGAAGYRGKTANCQFERERRRLQKIADRLNAQAAE